MRKRNVNRLTESKLQRIINESVKKVLREGHWDQKVYNEFLDIREAIGDDALISELYNWMDGDSIEGFIESVKRDYDFDYNGNE